MTPKGGAQPGAGRPKVHDEPMTRRHVYLPEAIYEWYAQLGADENGKPNASAGIERLAREHMESRPATAREARQEKEGGGER